MSAVKNLLGDTDFEKVEEILVEKGLDTDEAREVYHKAGGDTAYFTWVNLHGNQLAEEWLEERIGDSISNYELMFDGGVYMLKSYVQYVKTLN